MQELLTQRPWLLAVMAMLALAEVAWARFVARRTYDFGATLASVGVAIGQFLIKPVTGGIILAVYGSVYALAPWQLPISDWRVWGLGFFAVEFAYYWFHRWSHRINWLWATHAVHHSANELTLPAAIRLGWTGVLSGGWLVFTPLIILGFPPAMIGLLLALNLLYQFGLHTETVRQLGPLEWVLNTPSHHRAHHASDRPWLDCNFGGVLIIFDRWFGTFVPEPDQGGLHYGLTEPIRSNNPFTIALAQWFRLLAAMRRARGWRDRVRLAFGPPAMLGAIDSEGGKGPQVAELSMRAFERGLWRL
jgi:sterol desaturase/sphingolipid hydroxylase (fatty acid hydroxylase superfamily)